MEAGAGAAEYHERGGEGRACGGGGTGRVVGGRRTGRDASGARAAGGSDGASGDSEVVDAETVGVE